MSLPPATTKALGKALRARLDATRDDPLPPEMVEALRRLEEVPPAPATPERPRKV